MSITETDYTPSRIETLDQERLIRQLHGELSDQEVEAELAQWTENERLRRRNAAEAAAATAEAQRALTLCQICQVERGKNRWIHGVLQEEHITWGVHVAGEGLRLKVCPGCYHAVATEYAARRATEKVGTKTRAQLAKEYLDNLETKQ